jgi:hypothetical protein
MKSKSEVEVAALEAALPYLKKMLPPAELEEQVQEYAQEILAGSPVEERSQASRLIDEIVRGVAPSGSGKP